MSLETSPWQLLIHEDPDVLQLSEAAVQTAIPDPLPARIRVARNIADARVLLAQPAALDLCNLVVLGASTPENGTSSVSGPSREPTKRFIRLLKRNRPELNLIALAAVPDEPLSEFLDAFDRTCLIKFDGNWRDVLAREVAKLLSPARAAYDTGGVRNKETEYLELEIEFDDMKSAHWSMERRGRLPFEDGGIIQLDAGLFKGIVDRSDQLERQIERERQVKSQDWRQTLRDLSRELEEMFKQTISGRTFWNTFVHERDMSGGLASTRIRFVVSEDTHGAFVEALKEQSDVEHWMLNLPMFRKYPCPARRFPLFKDIASRNGPISCLVIEAHREGGTVEFAQSEKALPTLPKLADEARDVVNILEQAKAEHDGWIVDHLKLSDVVASGGDLLQTVLAKLDERHWNIIHFCGHAVEDRDSKTAGLVLSAQADSVISFDAFSKHLLETQFLFLSCCRSADSNLIMRAAKQSVPAVLGFRWQVDDDGAANFARAFYTELFNRKNLRYKYLEFAFRDARKRLYELDDNDPTWASPILFIQLKHAEAA